MDLNKFKIDIINLAHRADRKAQVIDAMKKIIDIEITEKNFFPAVHMPDNGMLGCALSHFSVLTEFIRDTNYDYQVVFEDDIEFKQEFQIRPIYEFIVKNEPNIDVFLFSHNHAVITKSMGINFQQVVNSQTASGYLVTRTYAPKLIECFARAINFMLRFKDYQQKAVVNALFAHDILWKQLQLEGCWIATDPALGFQRQSYSDIENKDVWYGGV